MFKTLAYAMDKTINANSIDDELHLQARTLTD